MPTLSSYAVHCDFCRRVGPHRPHSYEAELAAERAGYESVHRDFYGNEAWACPDCKGGPKVREFLAAVGAA